MDERLESLGSEEFIVPSSLLEQKHLPESKLKPRYVRMQHYGRKRSTNEPWDGMGVEVMLLDCLGFGKAIPVPFSTQIYSK
jgi:hypothetical protein